MELQNKSIQVYDPWEKWVCAKLDGKKTGRIVIIRTWCMICLANQWVDFASSSGKTWEAARFHSCNDRAVALSKVNSNASCDSWTMLKMSSLFTYKSTIIYIFTVGLHRKMSFLANCSCQESCTGNEDHRATGIHAGWRLRAQHRIPTASVWPPNRNAKNDAYVSKCIECTNNVGKELSWTRYQRHSEAMAFLKCFAKVRQLASSVSTIAWLWKNEKMGKAPQNTVCMQKF